MTTAGQPTGYFNTTYAVEFTVEGDLDGTTLQPPLLDSPPDPSGNTDPQQLYRRTVENLGLIDPDYTVPVEEDGRRGTRGMRFVTFIWIEGPAPGVLGASINVVDAVDGTPIVQKNIGDLGGVDRFFRFGIVIPQGSMIQLGGMSGSAADPIKVRLHIQYLNNAEAIAAALEAECCLEENGNGPPPPVTETCLTQFLVANDPNCAPFQSIQDAYNAAKAAGFGYGAAKGPTQVLVCNGDYTENVTMDTPGIDIVAVSPNPVGENVFVGLSALLEPLGEARLLGTLTVSYGAAPDPTLARAAWRGIDIVPANGRGVHFTGANPQVLKISDCFVQSQDAEGLFMDNTVGDPDEALVDARNAVFSSVASTPGNPGVGISGQQNFRTWNVFIGTADPVGLNTVAFNPTGGAIAFLDNTVVFNQTVAVEGFIQAFDSFFIFDDNSAVDLDSDSFLQAIDCKFQGTTGGGSFITGSGFFVHDGMALLADVDWSSTLIVFQLEGLPQEQFWKPVDLAGGSFPLSGETNILVSGPAVPGNALLLPPFGGRAGPYRIIEDALTSSGPVVVTAQAGDTIVVGTNPPAASVTLPPPSAGSSGGFMIVYDRISGRWYVMNFGGAAGAPALDLTLDPFNPGGTQPPLLFTDLPPILASQIALPAMATGIPVANRLWFGFCDFSVFGGITPGLYPMPNTDGRGADAGGGFFGSPRNQTFISSGPLATHIIDDLKRVEDLLIDAGPPGNGGPFFFTSGRGTFINNVTTFGPANGSPGAPPFQMDFNRVVVDKCQFFDPGIEAGGTVELVVEDDNIFGPGALQGPGFFFVEVKGTGNTFDEFMGAALAGVLDIDIGNSSPLGNPPWSGAESINFGAGPGSLAPGAPLLLFPGGGDPAAAAPLPTGGPDFPAEVCLKDGILRGIQVNAGGAITADFIDVDILIGGIVVYTETVFLLGGIGSFVSTTFGFMEAGGGARPISVIVRPPVGGTTAAWGYINVGVLIK